LKMIPTFLLWHGYWSYKKQRVMLKAVVVGLVVEMGISIQRERRKWLCYSQF
jgi:hypothetical protein